MAAEPSRGQSKKTVKFRLGEWSLDMQTSARALPSGRYAVGDNLRLDRGLVARRDGSRRVAILTDVTAAAGSWTFGTTGKYAQVPAAAQQLIPVGGFALAFHFSAARPSAGNTAHYLATRVTGKTYGPFSVTLSDAGVVTAAWRKESDESAVSIASTAQADGASVHGWLVYDPYTSGGKSNLIINGADDGTPVTAIGAAEQPMQDNPLVHFGVQWNPDAGPAAPVANTQFLGKCDSSTLFAFNARSISDTALGGSTLMATLRKWVFQDWPNPESAMVRWHYAFDEGTGTQLTDSSRFKNHGTITGAASATAGVARRIVNGQFVGVLEQTSGARLNVVASGGAVSTESVRGGF